MKAIVQDKYGSSDDVYELMEIDKPVVKDDEVLVRVRAATARWSWDIPAGLRYIGRIAVKLRKPRNSVPGLEMAGQVEAVGMSVKQFQPGDEVFGWGKSTLAEYVSLSEHQLALKPANLTFEQAAVVPYSGFTALQGLRDKGQINCCQGTHRSREDHTRHQRVLPLERGSPGDPAFRRGTRPRESRNHRLSRATAAQITPANLHSDRQQALLHWIMHGTPDAYSAGPASLFRLAEPP